MAAAAITAALEGWQVVECSLDHGGARIAVAVGLLCVLERISEAKRQPQVYIKGAKVTLKRLQLSVRAGGQISDLGATGGHVSGFG
jgi:hypothetical protein